MEQIIRHVKENEEFLTERIIEYSIEQGYSKYTSTLKEAVRISIEGLSLSITSAIESSSEALELSPEDNYSQDPVSKFGILEATKHRERGIDLNMFLGLFKYYRQSYHDLFEESELAHDVIKTGCRLMDRCFDRIEIAFCSEWARLGKDQAMNDLQAANRAITNEKNRYLTIFESINTPVLLVGVDGLLENFNYAAATLFTGTGGPGEYYYRQSRYPNPGSASEKDARPETAQKEKVETVLPWLAEKIQQALAEKQPPSGFETSVSINDKTCWFQVIISRQLDFSGKFTGLVVVLNDISAIRDYQEQLRESEQRYRALFENASDAIAVVDLETAKFDFVNPSARKLFGYSEEEFRNLTIVDISAEKTKTAEKLNALKTGLATLSIPERSFLRKDHSSFIGEVNAAVFEDSARHRKIIISYRNITHRKQYERELVKSERKFRIAFERSRDAIFWADAETGLIIECNESAEKLMERSRDELIGMHQRLLHPPEDIEKSTKEFQAHVEESGAEDVEADILSKSGKRIPVQISSSITVIDSMLINQGVFRNISSIKNVEAALRESKTKYRDLVHSARSMIVKLDRQGNITFFNEYAQKFFGYSEEEVIGKNVIGTILPEVDSSGRDLKEMVSSVYSSPSDFNYNENENMCKDGSLVWVAWSNRPVYDADGNFEGILCCGTDQTMRRDTENQLRIMAVAVEQSDNAILITDTDGVIKMSNVAIEKLTGYSREELIGQKPSILKSGYYEQEHYKKMWKTIKGGAIWNGIMRNKKKNGELYWEEATISPVFNDNDEITHFIQIKADITERKENEEKIQSLLGQLQMQRDELETFAYMVSHDLKAPLITIEGFSEALIEEYGAPADSDARHYMSRIFESARKMRTMMNDILEYAKVGVVEKNIEDISFRDIVWECLEDKKQVIRKKNTTPIVTGVDAVIRGERTRVYEIFDNLISNALKYCTDQEGLVPEITVGTSVNREGRVSFFIRDNGPGIREEELEKVFNLFFRSATTKSIEGSGVGLAIVKRIVEKYNGSISAVSNAPKPGVTFTFDLGNNATTATAK